MNKILISMIIPCYNVEQYIGRTIESIKNQERLNFEVILIDDGSSDNTLVAIKESLKTVNFLYKVIHQENQGVSAARNRGIEEASGEYIYFLDGDDTIESTFAEEVEEKIKTTCADIIYFGYNHVSLDNSVIKPVEQVFKYSKEPLEGKEAVKSMLKGKIHICAISAVYSRELINKYKIRYTVGSTIGEDEEFTYKALFYSSKVVAIEKLLAHYLKREGANFQPNEKQLHRFQSKIRLYEYFEKAGVDLETLNILKHYNIPFFTMISLVILAKSNFNKERLLEILRDETIRDNLRAYKGKLLSKEDVKFKIKALLAIYFPERFIYAFRKGNKLTC